MTNPQEIGKIFADHFNQQFGSRRASRFRVDLRKLLAHKRQVDLSPLERPFSLEEIKEAVFNLGRDKALGQRVFRCNFSVSSRKSLSWIF